MSYSEHASETERPRRPSLKINVKLNIIFRAASGIAPTHRRTSHTTRTGSKRRSMCCFAVRPSRRQSEASEGARGGGVGVDIIFLICNLCSKRLIKLFWEVFWPFLKERFFLMAGRCILYFNVWLINKDFLSITNVSEWVFLLLSHFVFFSTRSFFFLPSIGFLSFYLTSILSFLFTPYSSFLSYILSLFFSLLSVEKYYSSFFHIHFLFSPSFSLCHPVCCWL